MHATDVRSEELEDLQAAVGEGPGVDTLSAGAPTLVDDLASRDSRSRWPVFAAEACRLGVRGMFSLPVGAGAIQVGVLDLYRDGVGGLTAGELADALVYVDALLLLALNGQAGTEAAEGILADESMLRRAEVHQAAGMVSVQLGVPVADALVRLRAYAYARDLRVAEVARAVVRRTLRFSPDGDPPAPEQDQGGMS
ncbi:ANTAR domain-containing protein [Amycolatopsis anabasis]|uniref:ANTAR domain-containing protein n=1 Tax=Amycolatopsis anabasis TaxID=1840409 RepID=UPI00131CC8A7|nr:ANTAR domain-containing protein [Amycolatopsis anabasis]